MQIDGNLPNFIILKNYNEEGMKGNMNRHMQGLKLNIYYPSIFLYIYRMGLNVIKVIVCHLLGMAC
jgi:hypothetical protein